MAKYEPQVIVEFADRLLTRAASITALYGLFGLLLAGPGGILIGAATNTSPEVIGGLGAVVGLAMGVVIGREKGFLLRLQAQQALCQVQIEFNTRRT
jgi:hypothetical protein